MIFSMESEDGEAPVFFNARNHYSFFFPKFCRVCTNGLSHFLCNEKRKGVFGSSTCFKKRETD